LNTPVLPQLTVKAILLGIVLSAVLAGANAYLGLFAGLTVSASIPAAVISMAVLRLFKESNILENNIVQTAASAGESLAAGVIFTLPALILLGYWDVFDYVWVTVIAGLGGLLGVLFTGWSTNPDGLLAGFLESQGIEVDQAGSAEEALESIRTALPNMVL